MQIDFHTVTIGGHTGYGNASRLLSESLKSQGVEIRSGSSTLLNFCMPNAYRYSDLTIGYTPWESTEIPDGWMSGLNEVDDFWTTTGWCKDVFGQYTDRDVFVLPHGIEPCWTPVKHERNPGRPFTFLHMGEPAVRKGGDIVLTAWYRHFRHRKDVKLIFKCQKYTLARVKDRGGSIVYSAPIGDNVDVIDGVMTQPELHGLFSNVDCMVYPTRGEGFGLIPFEAMGSGLPTILPGQGGTGEFAGYSNLILQNSLWVNSPETKIHPGKWMTHDLDEVVALMEDAIEDYDIHSRSAFRSAELIHYAFSWKRIAQMAEQRIKSLF